MQRKGLAAFLRPELLAKRGNETETPERTKAKQIFCGGKPDGTIVGMDIYMPTTDIQWFSGVKMHYGGFRSHSLAEIHAIGKVVHQKSVGILHDPCQFLGVVCEPQIPFGAGIKEVQDAGKNSSSDDAFKPKTYDDFFPLCHGYMIAYHFVVCNFWPSCHLPRWQDTPPPCKATSRRRFVPQVVRPL